MHQLPQPRVSCALFEIAGDPTLFTVCRVSHAITWKIMKPNLAVLIQDVVFPLMCHSDEDEELWQTDPVEYIRIKYDVFEEFFSPVTAAQTLLHTAVSKRKEVLNKTMGFVMSVLTAQALEPRQKAGALHMVGAVADILITVSISPTLPAI
jgi:hypothetical protein